jgi:hypothetical protein
MAARKRFRDLPPACVSIRLEDFERRFSLVGGQHGFDLVRRQCDILRRL